jgi:DNA-binding transcriptional ArsR family regulator
MKGPFTPLRELGDETRLRVFIALLGRKKNVSEITAELGLTQPQVSYHLRKLKEADLAVEEKDGRWVWYEANRESGDRNIRGLIELLARWAADNGMTDAEDVSVLPPRPSATPAAVIEDEDAEETSIELPGRKQTEDMDDFLL